ncbi:MAG: glycosyltransferase family 2 protein, partial [Trueperaceae bacterium]
MTRFRDLTIAVIHHRTPELLDSCLERVKRSAPGARLLVIDTGGTSLDELPTDQAEFVQLENHSYAHAVNTALKRCHTPYFAQMNADVLVEPETFTTLLDILERPDVGMVGPQCRDKSGRWQDQGPLYRLHHLQLKQRGQSSVSVPWLSGCLQVLKMEAVQHTGGMNPGLRFYNDDLEWCWRIRRAGDSCRLVATEVLHLGGSSTPASLNFLVEGYRGGYLLSLRYKPHLYQLLHRWVVMFEATLQQRFATESHRREAYAQILEMFRQ